MTHSDPGASGARGNGRAVDLGSPSFCRIVSDSVIALYRSYGHYTIAASPVEIGLFSHEKYVFLRIDAGTFGAVEYARGGVEGWMGGPAWCQGGRAAPPRGDGGG